MLHPTYVIHDQMPFIYHGTNDADGERFGDVLAPLMGPTDT